MYATMLLSPKYEAAGYRSMRSTSMVMDEFQIQRYVNLSSLPRIEGAKFLVFLQAEKLALQERAKTMKLDVQTIEEYVSTVHEYQGKQTDHIILVRTSTVAHAVYDSDPHLLVAISRHRLSFTYVTADVRDTMSRWMRTVMGRPQSEYMRYHHKPPTLSGGRADYEVVYREPAYAPDGVFEQTQKLGPALPCCTYRSHPDLDPVLEDPPPPVNFVCDIESLQHLYDEVFPGASCEDYSGDIYSVNVAEPLALNLANMVIDASRVRNFKQKSFDRLHPLLRTHMPHVRPGTAIETLVAMVKRNLNVPEIKGETDPDTVAEYMFERLG